MNQKKVKTMELFFARLTQNHWVPKNSAHKALDEMAISMDRKVFMSNKDKLTYLESLKEKVQEINNQFKRCRNYELNVYSPFDRDNDLIVSVHDVFTIEIVSAKSYPEDGKQ